MKVQVDGDYREQRLQEIFHVIDVNKDGFLDIHEICEAFRNIGIEVNETEAKKMIKHMKRSGNSGEPVDFEDWRSFLINHPHPELYSLMNYWKYHSTFVDLGEDALVPDDFQESDFYNGAWWRHLVAGGLAGAVSRTCTAPLDRLKVFLQVRGGEFNSLRSCFSHMLKEGGWRSLWRGNGINVLKIAPESAIKFMAYEQAKRFMLGNKSCELNIFERFVSGSMAGAISQTVIYPMEVLKTRLCLRSTGQYGGIFDAAKRIYKNERLRAFYRGYLPNLLGIIPYAGIDLAIYETIKKWYLRTHAIDENPGILVLLTCGTISSSCGQIASYPLALVRTRLQAQILVNEQNNLPYHNYNHSYYNHQAHYYQTHQQVGMVNVFRDILYKEGFRGLYRGIAPNFMKVAPAVSISYVVYEKTRRALGVEMT